MRGHVAGMRNDSLRTILAIVITVVWAVAAIASVLQQQFKTLEVVTPVMMIVTGFLFGYQISVKRNTQKKEGQ